MLVEDVLGLEQYTVSFLNPSDDLRVLVFLGDGLCIISGCDDIESHAHVQGLVDLLGGYVSELLDLLEERSGCDGVVDDVLA